MVFGAHEGALKEKTKRSHDAELINSVSRKQSESAGAGPSKSPNTVTNT